jgi:hypothetical protein
LSHRLSGLQSRIREDILAVLNQCQTEDELDFLFPEITRICEQDLAVLQVWQNQVDWIRSLPPTELQLLQIDQGQSDQGQSDQGQSDQEQSDQEQSDQGNSDALLSAAITEAQPLPPNPSDLPEQLLYKGLQQKSHPVALLDQLRFLVKPELRQAPETYVGEQAAGQGHTALTPANLSAMSDIAVANLFWYFKVRNESANAAHLTAT